MKIQYLEIVTKEVDAVSAAYASAQFCVELSRESKDPWSSISGLRVV